MNTYTNAIHPEKKSHQTTHNSMFHNTAIVTILLVLVTTVAIAAYIASRSAVAAENSLVVPYSNALELQYAQPWLDKAERLIVVTGNPQEQALLNCSSTMELLYACKYGYGLLK